MFMEVVLAWVAIGSTPFELAVVAETVIKKVVVVRDATFFVVALLCEKELSVLVVVCDWEVKL
jgi:hypothetical protein